MSIFLFLMGCLFLCTLGALALEANIFRTSSAMSPPGLTNVNCSGSEARFRDCDLSTFSHSCELASAVCQGGLFE